jgi:hypothetical protein
VPGSYKPLGNSGTCYNESITACDATQTPFDILRSLYFMSDHLPITLTLAPGSGTGISAVGATASLSLTMREHSLWITGGHGAANVQLHDASGRLLLAQVLNLQSTGTSCVLPAGSHGLVLATVRDEDGAATARLLIPE